MLFLDNEISSDYGTELSAKTNAALCFGFWTIILARPRNSVVLRSAGHDQPVAVLSLAELTWHKELKWSTISKKFSCASWLLSVFALCAF